jgi:hypothetical protein
VDGDGDGDVVGEQLVDALLRDRTSVGLCRWSTTSPSPFTTTTTMRK